MQRNIGVELGKCKEAVSVSAKYPCRFHLIFEHQLDVYSKGTRCRYSLSAESGKLKNGWWNLWLSLFWGMKSPYVIETMQVFILGLGRTVKYISYSKMENSGIMYNVLVHTVQNCKLWTLIDLSPRS